MDISVAENAIGWIEANPEKHNQAMWATQTDCGTTMCLAGVIVSQAGAQIKFATRTETATCVTKDGEERSIPDYAAELLGVDFYGTIQTRLFYANNTLAEIKSIVKDVANGDLTDSSLDYDY